MYYFHMDEKMAEARIDALTEVVKEAHQDQKVSRKRALNLPKLSNLFANLSFEKKTAVATQA